MFKRIPGNNQYLISSEGKFMRVEAMGCTPDPQEMTPVDGKVTISLYGKKRKVAVLWLTVIAMYEVVLPVGYEYYLTKVQIAPINAKVTKSPIDWMPVFPKPIQLDLEYRVIPQFSRYAVSRKGDVKDLYTGIKLVWSTSSNPSYYPTVAVFTPVKDDYISQRVHRLVALAWVANDDWFGKPIVNHLDGNKHNPNASNLEWTSYTGNALHAFSEGLRDDNLETRVRDAFTGEITLLPSLRQACEFMGLSADQLRRTRKHLIPGRLINERFEVRVVGDEEPWFYNEPLTQPEKLGKRTTTVTFPDGKQEVFRDNRDLQKRFKLWNMSPGIETLVNALIQKHPELKVDVVEHTVQQSVQAYCIATGEVFEAPGIKAMARLIGIDWQAIRTSLQVEDTRVTQGYLFRYQRHTPWDLQYTYHTSERKCIVATHQLTKEQHRFESLRKVAEHFAVDRSVIRNRLRTKQLYREWSLEYAEE